MADFPIVPSKTAMLFFDCLNIYLHPEDPERQAAINESGIITTLQKINTACRAAGISVFYAQADHRPDHRDFAPHIADIGYTGQPGDPPRKTTPPPVVGDSRGSEVIEEIAPQPGDYVIKKHRWSTFFQTHFELSLRTAGIDTLMLAGGAVEVGIASTAYAGRDMDFNQIILRDACTSMRPEVKDIFMTRVFPIYARVMDVDDAIALIEK
jgi:nicotinamidase-related amidase